MSNVVLFFQVHLPYKLRKYSFFEIGESPFYEHSEKNFTEVMKAATSCYLPSNKILLNLIKKHEGRFKVSFAISGLSLDLFEEHAPEVIESFQALAQTGCVDFVAMPYYNSLAYLYSKSEFTSQVEMHAKKMKKLFNVKPKVFCNTELIYNDDNALWAEEAGYKAVLADKGLHTNINNPNLVYNAQNAQKLKLLFRNNSLSEDISGRFSDTSWSEYPLKAKKYASWIFDCGDKAQTINLFLRYENFGLYHTKEEGIFEFLKEFPTKVLQNENFVFKTLSEVAKLKASAQVSIPMTTSWERKTRDVSIWQNNDLQKDALLSCYNLEKMLQKANDKNLTKIWQVLQDSEHIYAMSMHERARDPEKLESPYEAYINYMNILSDLQLRVKHVAQEK